MSSIHRFLFIVFRVYFSLILTFLLFHQDFFLIIKTAFSTFCSIFKVHSISLPRINSDFLIYLQLLKFMDQQLLKVVNWEYCWVKTLDYFLQIANNKSFKLTILKWMASIDLLENFLLLFAQLIKVNQLILRSQHTIFIFFQCDCIMSLNSFVLLTLSINIILSFLLKILIHQIYFLVIFRFIVDEILRKVFWYFRRFLCEGYEVIALIVPIFIFFVLTNFIYQTLLTQHHFPQIFLLVYPLHRNIILSFYSNYLIIYLKFMCHWWTELYFTFLITSYSFIILHNFIALIWKFFGFTYEVSHFFIQESKLIDFFMLIFFDDLSLQLTHYY